MPASHADPSKGWELLQAPALTSHPDRIRLLCRVCWIALDRGMAEKVIFVLSIGTLSHKLNVLYIQVFLEQYTQISTMRCAIQYIHSSSSSLSGGSLPWGSLHPLQ